MALFLVYDKGKSNIASIDNFATIFSHFIVEGIFQEPNFFFIQALRRCGSRV